MFHAETYHGSQIVTSEHETLNDARRAVDWFDMWTIYDAQWVMVDMA